MDRNEVVFSEQPGDRRTCDYIKRGLISAFIEPSGCGKATLLPNSSSKLEPRYLIDSISTRRVESPSVKEP